MNRNWKNISVPECLGIIICSLICCLVAVIPLSLDPMTLSFKEFPLIASEGTGILSIIESINEVGLPRLSPMLEDYLEQFGTLYKLAIEGYFFILILNIVASILLILTQSKGLRIVFRFFSAFFGIIIILIAVLFAVYIVSIFMAYKELGLTFNDVIFSCGGLFALGMVVFGIILGAKQLRWFKAPFKF